MDVKESDILGQDINRHWYYQSKARAMMSLLSALSPKKILDVGAGSGFFSRYLLAHTQATEAWCVDTSYAADFDESEADASIHYRRSIGASDSDLVLLMDVLEHVDDDVSLLRSYVEKVPAGSQFLITVPAFQFLWSGHDEFLQHKRRYTLAGLQDTVSKSGLSIERSCYYFGAVLPIAAGLRLMQRDGKGETAQSQLRTHHPFINGLLAFICRMELYIMKANRVGGLTVFCLATKQRPGVKDEMP